MTKIRILSETLSKGEAALITSPVSRMYLTEFSSSDGFLFLTREKAFFFLDSRYFEMACLFQEKGEMPKEITLRSDRFFPALEEIVTENKIERIFFEDRFVTVSTLSSLEKKYPKLSFLPLEDRIEKMRIVKSREEIEKIAAAQKLAEAAFSYVLPRLNTNRTENDVAAEIEYFMKKNGASGPSFSTICVSGSRSSLPHGTPTEAFLTKNSFVTMDFGCVLDGYASDMTRTVCLGKASEEMRLVYDTVLKAQKNAILSVRAGVTGKDADLAARGVIEKAGFGEYFGHSTGHGIGLEVHEAPSFSPSYEKKIPCGAVLSVEPGIYLPGKFGVRIEDLVAVEENGCRNLNFAPKELIEL